VLQVKAWRKQGVIMRSMNGILAGGFGMRTAGFVITVAAMLLDVESSARASLVGDTVSAVNLFPDTTTVAHNLGTATVGPGVEFEFGLDIDFGSSTLTLSTVAGVDFTHLGPATLTALDSLI
jgi:hypothetical protein